MVEDTSNLLEEPKVEEKDAEDLYAYRVQQGRCARNNGYQGGGYRLHNALKTAYSCRLMCDRDAGCVAWFFYAGYRKDCYSWRLAEVKGVAGDYQTKCNIKIKNAVRYTV